MQDFSTCKLGYELRDTVDNCRFTILEFYFKIITISLLAKCNKISHYHELSKYHESTIAMNTWAKTFRRFKDKIRDPNTQRSALNTKEGTTFSLKGHQRTDHDSVQFPAKSRENTWTGNCRWVLQILQVKITEKAIPGYFSKAYNSML